jgi:hypothetical protein
MRFRLSSRRAWAYFCNVSMIFIICPSLSISFPCPLEFYPSTPKLAFLPSLSFSELEAIHTSSILFSQRQPYLVLSLAKILQTHVQTTGICQVVILRKFHTFKTIPILRKLFDFTNFPSSARLYNFQVIAPSFSLPS